MPKLKTKSAAKKRFSVTGTGKLKRNFAKKRHCLFCKSPKMKRQARGSTLLSESDAIIVKKFLPYLQEDKQMSRVKRGVIAHARHKKILKMAKGYRGRNKNVFRVAVEKVEKALQYAYRDRRAKKRSFRSLWIQRINAATRMHDMTYSRFMSGLNKAGIELDRKVLADIALKEPANFAKLVEAAKSALN